MKLGVLMFATDYAIRPDELAVACEERGFESVWFPEHTHIPASRRSPWPVGGELPRDYWHTYDLFVSLMAAAAATRTIKLGSGSCLVIERDPSVLAKEVASVDHLSHGRLLFGIGGGWNAEEMAHHGTPFQRRWQVLRERIEAMKAIWSQEAAEYHGEFVHFDPIWSSPKPLQQPHPPILLGTLSAQGLQRVVRYCDGWIPGLLAPTALAEAMRTLRALAEQAGRTAHDFPVSIFGVPGEEATLRQYQELGVERAVLAAPSVGRAQILPVLDQYAALIAKCA